MAVDVLILVALLAEERLLQEVVHGTSERVIAGKRFVAGTLGGRRMMIGATGMGKVNAAAITMLGIQQVQPRAVIGTGIAGATDPNLLPGDVIVAEQVGHFDFGEQSEEGYVPWRTKGPLDFEPNPLFFPAADKLLGAAKGTATGSNLEQHPDFAERRPPAVVRGTLVTGDTFGPGAKNRRRLWEQYQAHACDMESAAISQVCWTYDILFLAIRGISDVEGGAMEQLKRYAALAMSNAVRVVQSVLVALDVSEPDG